MDIISILQAWIKARILKCLSITQAESNLPDAYIKKKVYLCCGRSGKKKSLKSIEYLASGVFGFSPSLNSRNIFCLTRRKNFQFLVFWLSRSEYFARE